VESVRDTILKEAVRLFAEHGFDVTSVQDIVNAAHVTKGAFYYYFTSKNDLLYEIHQGFMAVANRHAEEILAENLPPEETLRTMIATLIQGIANFQAEVTVFFREMHRLSPEHRSAMRTERNRYEAFFGSVIERGQAEGSFRPDISSRLQTLGILSMCNGTYTWYRLHGPVPARQIGEAFADLLLSGIKTPITEKQNSIAPASEADPVR
jgi:AcrR family transcriptional regulator